MDARARLTVPDVLFALFALASLGALYPVFVDLFNNNIGVIPTGAAWLFQMIVPMAILVLMTMIYVRATEGAI